jgi:hypothetical protein
VEPFGEKVTAAVLELLRGPVTPAAVRTFEERLTQLSGELNREVVEFTYNHVEPAQPETLPHHLWFEGSLYRRLNQKTRNAHVATRFGKIVLWRFAYRDDHTGARCLFPLERQLGLVEGASPALADRVARAMAETGATQQRVLAWLRAEHGVEWGVEKLRDFTQTQAERMEPFRQACSAARVLELLEQARRSSGSCKPVLAVGRDGITLQSQPHGFWEVATTATVTVYDRRGRRLGTVALAYPPELGQGTMSDQLTGLLEEVLRQWSGPLPRLCYVTDAGENETKYYRTVLRRMRHPVSGQRLPWQRIIDYYHASERISTLAEALFGNDEQGKRAWARRMRRSLLKPSGPSRVLHSAATLRRRRRRKMSETAREDFDRAYDYLRRRTRFMDYHGYRQTHLPIGSGVTEAACKTLFTERLKLSGMRWKKAGAEAVLRLRVILRSGIWDAVRDALLAADLTALPRPYSAPAEQVHQIAA